MYVIVLAWNERINEVLVRQTRLSFFLPYLMYSVCWSVFLFEYQPKLNLFIFMNEMIHCEASAFCCNSLLMMGQKISQVSLKYLHLFFKGESKSYGFGMTQMWVNGNFQFLGELSHLKVYIWNLCWINDSHDHVEELSTTQCLIWEL